MLRARSLAPLVRTRGHRDDAPLGVLTWQLRILSYGDLSLCVKGGCGAQSRPEPAGGMTPLGKIQTEPDQLRTNEERK